MVFNFLSNLVSSFLLVYMLYKPFPFQFLLEKNVQYNLTMFLFTQLWYSPYLLNNSTLPPFFLKFFRKYKVHKTVKAEF